MQLPFTKRAGTDPDALAYFARAGIASGTQTPSSYDNAASFNGTNQFLQTTASNISIASGESFSFAGWFQLTANPSTNRASLVSMTSGTQNVVLYVDTFNQAYSFRCRNSTGPLDLNPAIYTTIPLNTYIFLHGQYDASLQKTAVSVNNGSFTYSTATGNPITGVSSFIRFNGDGNLAGASFFPGSMSNWGFWKRALSASEVTSLFNSGAGRTYASLDSGLLTNLISWWALNGTSSAVSLTDSHGVVTGTPNTLTNNGTVTAPNIGPVVTTTENSRQLINNFVKGIKSLGLWNSMVCWPLRSSQNAGSGLTARSLGGLGTFDGTLAGGTLPSWTANGLSLAASSQMNASVTTVPENVTLLFAAAGNGTQTAFAQYFGLQNASAWSANEARIQDGLNNNGITNNQRNSVINANSGAISPNPFNSPAFSFVSGSLNQAGSLLNVRNLNTGAASSATPSATGTNTLNRLQLNGRWDGSLALGTPHTAAFCGYITPASDGQVSAIYSLYRNTLGIGLALP
jgi:hypothetical protein